MTDEPVPAYSDEDRKRLRWDRALAYIDRLETRVKELEEALRLIATPPRPDGTYNRSREACEELAHAYPFRVEEGVS